MIWLQSWNIYVTGFDKTRLPHTSNYLISNSCNLTIRYCPRNFTCSFHIFIKLLIKFEHDGIFLHGVMVFQSCKLDVCWSLVLSNPVTYRLCRISLLNNGQIQVLDFLKKLSLLFVSEGLQVQSQHAAKVSMLHIFISCCGTTLCIHT